MKFHNAKALTTVLAILAVVVIYTIIKIPYFDHNFTGEHSMKYSTYVEPALYMVEEKNPFHFQRTYSADPIEDWEGLTLEFPAIENESKGTIPQFPILEWKLAGMFALFPNLSIEMSTRIVMHAIGVITLIFSFLFVKEFVNRITAFIFTLLLATNPIFGFATFVTVYDSFNLMMLFIALFFLIRYLKNPKLFYCMAIAGVISGLGAAAKESMLLWILPIALILIFYESHGFFKKLFNIVSYILFLIIPYAITKVAIPTIGIETNRNLVILGLSFLMIVLLTILLPKTIPLIENLHKKKILIPIFILALIPTALIFFNLFYNPTLFKEFITDTKIFFNIDVYISMARQFLRYIGIPLALIGVFGMLSLPFLKDRSVRILGFSFLMGGIFFFLTAAKSIFFHDYYTIFLMAVVLLNASIFLSLMFEKINHLQLNFLIIILLAVFVLYPRATHMQAKISIQEDQFDQALEYFVENTKEYEFYIDEVQATYFSLYSGRPRVRDLVMLEDENFKKDVRELGFKEAMDKYNIKYLITFHEEPEYEKFANIFSEKELLRPSYRRSDLILSMVRPEEYEYFKDIEEREFIIEEHNLKEKFVFEKQIGNFRFFTFAN
jgi:hypothetical protein